MNLEELERLAKEASEGPWEFRMDRVDQPDEISDGIAIAYDIMKEANGEYIAAANPKVILEMIEKIRNLEIEVENWKYEASAD